MIKVKDINGNIIRGVYRTPLGSLVVKDDVMLEKHIHTVKSRIDSDNKIKSLEADINELKLIISKLTGNLK